MGASASSLVSSVLREYGDATRAVLFDYLPAKEPRRYLYDLAAEYPRRGGRAFRPSLCIATARAFGTPMEAALPHGGVDRADPQRDAHPRRHRGRERAAARQADDARGRGRADRDQRGRHALAAVDAAAARQPPSTGPRPVAPDPRGDRANGARVCRGTGARSRAGGATTSPTSRRRTTCSWSSRRPAGSRPFIPAEWVR